MCVQGHGRGWGGGGGGWGGEGIKPYLRGSSTHCQVTYLPLPCKRNGVTSYQSVHLDHQHEHLVLTPVINTSKGPVSQLVNAKDYISRQCTSILKG